MSLLRESTLADSALLLSYLRHCTPSGFDAALHCLADLHTLRLSPSPLDMIHLCDALRLNVTIHTLVLGGMNDRGLRMLATLRHPTLHHLTLFQTEWTTKGQHALLNLLANAPLLTCCVEAYTPLAASLAERLMDRLSPTLTCICLASEWSERLAQKIDERSRAGCIVILSCA